MKQKLKIKLLSPRMSLRPMDTEFKRLMSPSLSLVMVASLTPPEHEVIIEDENIADIVMSDSPDLVGINVNVDTSHRAFAIADQYRKRGIPVVFGGIHASANPEEMLEHCDSVVVGEAEILWPQLIQDLLHGTMKPIYRNTTEVDLGMVPIPNWNTINKEKYLYHNVVVTSRGCPFKCDFCYNSSEYIASSFRNRPIENVIEEIESLGTKQVMFIDDNFIGSIKWTTEFIKKITPLNISWHAAVTTNILHHPKLLDSFVESGCKSLFIGFESINAQSLSSVQKGQNKVTEYETLIKLLHDKGIMVNASVVFGFDHDTKDVFKTTLQWLVTNKVETVTAHILTPYPGTRLYKRLSEENRIIESEPTKYNTAHVTFEPKGMTATELREGYLWFYKEFYTFRNIFKRVPTGKKNRASYLLFNLFYRKFGTFFSKVASCGLMKRTGKIIRKLSYGID